MVKRQGYVNSTPWYSPFFSRFTRHKVHELSSPAFLDTVTAYARLKTFLSPFERLHLEFLVADPFPSMPRDNLRYHVDAALQGGYCTGSSVFQGG